MMTPPDPVMPITLDGLLKLWQLLGAPLVGVVALYVRDISRQLRAINGRLKTVESVTTSHERELDQIQREIHGRHQGRTGSGGP